MMYYFDSSALVKKYIEESGSETVIELLRNAEMPVTSKLAYPEILSGFGRKKRDKEIGEKEYRTAVTNFEADWPALLIIEYQDELLEIIKLLAEKHPLKGADLVHLASVLWLQKAAREKLTLVASDIQLIKASMVEKVEIINPESL